MKRVKLLDTASIPNGGGELGLYEHGEDFVIKIVGGQDLMSTRTHGSADALAEIACTEIACCERPRVLIGGMGMGFTLASALRHLGQDAEVVVAELVPEVVEWNRGPLGEHAGHPLRDERVIVHEGDVSIILREGGQSFDAILLDVDNGPEGLTTEGNDWLYSRAVMVSPLPFLASWTASQTAIKSTFSPGRPPRWRTFGLVGKLLSSRPLPGIELDGFVVVLDGLLELAQGFVGSRRIASLKS